MCCNIVKAFSAYRSPVNRVWNESIKVNAERLLSEESINEGKSISSIIEDITSDVLEHNDFLQRVRNLGWKNIERLVNKLFERQGYTLLKQNSADGQGGDADLIYNDNLVPELFDVSENGENVSGKIFVQIKNKTGVDESDIKGIQQVIQRAQDETVAIKILISTADSFTETCKKMANENGVLLISGKGLMKLILKYLD